MSGKVVVITGAAQGIGAATAKELAGIGMKIALLDIAKEELYSTTQSLLNEGRDVHSFICDVTKKDQVFATFENIKKLLGSIDILVPNAGVLNITAVDKAQLDKWLQAIEHLAPYCGSKHFVHGFATAIRQELAPLGIKVTCIQPGPVDTQLVMRNPDEQVLEICRKLGFLEPKYLKPEDIAESICFCLIQNDRVGVNEITLEEVKHTKQIF